jgi:hypothetical protein
MATVPRALLRPAAAVAAAALALHELRYRLAEVGPGGAAATPAGHGYVPFAQAVAVLLLVVAGAAGLRATARGADRRPGPGGLARDWARASAVLLLVHLGQEGTERLLAPGGAALGPEAVLGGGAWVAVPLAIALGAVVALLLRGAHHAERAVGAAARPRPLGPPGSAALPSERVAAPDRRLPGALATGGAGRAPPISAA